MRFDWLDTLFDALIVGVGIALAMSWARLPSLLRLPDFRQKRASTWPLILTTLSFAYFLLSFPLQDALLGTAFSQQRSVVIEINWVLTLSMAVVSIFKGGALKWWIMFAAVGLFLVWLILAAYSSAV
jgi:hypothetical protein